MISNKTRETRKNKVLKMPKNIERLYKEGKCSECSVVVTKMDFARILGKFTKVKIQYESGSTPKTRRENQLVTSPNTRLKSNENGMVLIHRNAYNQHPANLLKKSKSNEKTTLRNKILESPRATNILKENNRLKKTPISKEKNTNLFVKNVIKSHYLKTYGIIFVNPKAKNENYRHKISLQQLLPSIDKSMLPSNDWCIDYLPKQGEPKEDKVYDRIAAELEDLMNNEKPTVKSAALKPDTKVESRENKDEFPSIMDILNDSTSALAQANDQSIPTVQTNLESSDVEAMLLGKPSETPSSELKALNITPMEVDNTDISSLLLSAAPTDPGNLQNDSDIIDNPNSPSILDETLQKGIEEHLPKESAIQEKSVEPHNSTDGTKAVDINHKKDKDYDVKYNTVTHVVFKKYLDGVCSKSVTCPKNLKYVVELEGKSIQFLGAPKFVTSLEDLKVLLEIVNETELNSLYILH